MNKLKTTSNVWWWNQQTWLFKTAYRIGTFELYQNGDTPDISFKWYHPLGALLFLIILILLPILAMISDESLKSIWNDLKELYSVKKWFKDNPDRLKWIDRKEFLEQIS